MTDKEEMIRAIGRAMGWGKLQTHANAPLVADLLILEGFGKMKHDRPIYSTKDIVSLADTLENSLWQEIDQ